MGPTLSAWSFDLLAPVIYAGVFAVIMAMQIIMVILLLFTNIPPPTKTELSGPTRSFWEIASQPKPENLTPEAWAFFKNLIKPKSTTKPTKAQSTPEVKNVKKRKSRRTTTRKKV